MKVFRVFFVVSENFSLWGWGENFVNNSINFLISLITFNFLKFSFTHFLAIPQNFWGICRVWLKFLDDVSFFVSQFSNIWISEPLVRFGWITPHWKAIMLLVSYTMHLVIFIYFLLLRSAVFHRFQEKYVMWHHSTTFNPPWCFWYTYWPQMACQYVDLSKSWKMRGQPCSGNQRFKK